MGEVYDLLWGNHVSGSRECLCLSISPVWSTVLPQYRNETVSLYLTLNSLSIASRLLAPEGTVEMQSISIFEAILQRCEEVFWNIRYCRVCRWLRDLQTAAATSLHSQLTFRVPSLRYRNLIRTGVTAWVPFHSSSTPDVESFMHTTTSDINTFVAFRRLFLENWVKFKSC